MDIDYPLAYTFLTFFTSYIYLICFFHYQLVYQVGETKFHKTFPNFDYESFFEFPSSLTWGPGTLGFEGLVWTPPPPIPPSDIIHIG